MDANLGGAGEDAATVDVAGGEAFLSATGGAARHPMDTVGLGEYAAVAGEVVGGELVWEDEVVHLSAFAPA